MQATEANPGCGRGRRRQPFPLLLRLLLLAVGSYVVVTCYSCSHPRGALAFRPPAPACNSVRSSLRIRALPPAPLAGLGRSPSSRLTSRPTTTAPLHAWPTNRDPTSFARDFPVTAARVGITVLGTLLTYVAHANQRCSPVLASAAVTCAASLIAPGLGQAAMAGTFTGMSSSALLPSAQWALGAGALTSLLYESIIHARGTALGLGGRLGAIAFIAVNTIALLQGINGIPVASVTWPSLGPSIFRLGTPMSITLGFTALGALATMALREASDNQPVADPVRAAAVTGLLGSLLVGICGFSELASLSTYGGAFVGMSLPSRLMRGVVPGQRPRRNPPAMAAKTTIGAILASFTLAGALAGLLHGLSLQLGWFTSPAGWGGKAGACSFLGVALFRAGQRTVSWLRTRSKGLGRAKAAQASRWRRSSVVPASRWRD